jgi:tRNA modification GTPase
VSTPADTVAAIATPPGQGGVAVIRLSGPEALSVVGRLFRRYGGGGIDEPRRVYVGRLLERPGGATIDEVLVFAMAPPRSYTGEAVVEIQCHGGSVVSRRVLECVVAQGARPAEPGEFTKRALLNGRLDLAQAEAVADLIAARTDAGRRLAWSQLEGVLSARIGALRDALLGARALCEAAIDFPEEDVPELSGGELGREVARVRQEIDAMVAGFERARLRYEGARVALVGKPNVGKSSLLNALAGRERAIVTPIAGTTRDVVEAVVALRESPVVLADTAGLREVPDAVEAIGAERSRAAIADATCVVAVFDRAGLLDDDDRLVVDATTGRPTVVVLNKADLPARVDRGAVAGWLPDAPVVEVSATAGTGLADLEATLGRMLFGARDTDDAGEEVAIFRVRHRDAAQRASQDLARAEDALRTGAPPELVASDLAAAAAALGAITGELSTEEVLDRVFAEFCIGK